MFDLLTFPSFLLTLSILALSITLTKLVLVPYLKVRAYRKPNVSTFFFPLLGCFKSIQESIAKYGDAFGSTKKDAETSPDQKYWVSNVQADPLISLRGSQYIKDFLQKQHLYEKSKYIDILKLIAGTGLVVAEGNTWKLHRKIISNSFHYEFLKDNVPMVQDITRQFFDKLTSEDLANYAVIPKIQEITGEIVGTIFFGKHLNSYTFENQPLTLALADLVSELGNVSRDPLFLLFGSNIVKKPKLPKYKKLKDRIEGFRQIVYDMIQDRKAQKQKNHDLLDSLLATQASEDQENKYSDEDIVNEFVTFFIAGMDTTGHLIGMALFSLTQHPEYFKELEEEREQTYNLKERVSADNLQKMEVLHGFLKETLRLYSPAPTSFFKTSLQDHDLGDLKIKKGDLVVADFIFLFFNPKHFENPNMFCPERWKKGDLNLDPYAFTPFSAGPRNCIGQHLALIESKIIISEFLNRFDFQLRDQNYQLKMVLRFLYEPLDEVIFTLKPK